MAAMPFSLDGIANQLRAAHPESPVQSRRPQSLPQDQQARIAGTGERRRKYVWAYGKNVWGGHAYGCIGTGPSALDHFKDEVKQQFRELTWQKRGPKQ